MTDLLILLSTDQLVIPFWQMAMYLSILSLLMLARGHKLALITTFLFTFYWAFFLYFVDSMDSVGTFPATLYVVFGFCHVVFTIMAFMQEKGAKY